MFSLRSHAFEHEETNHYHVAVISIKCTVASGKSYHRQLAAALSLTRKFCKGTMLPLVYINDLPDYATICR